MNTNQYTTLTNQDAFEKWAVIQKDANGLPYFVIKAGNGSYVDNSTNHAWNAWQAATKASEQRIQELEAEVMKAQSYFMKSQRELRELQAHLNQLREVLQWIDDSSTDGMAVTKAHKALSSATAKSLAEHDNEVIDRCKNIVADDALAITFQSMGAYRSAIIRQLGELKASS